MANKTRFEQEIRIMQGMRHPRIAQLYDLYKDSINFYIFMEYCSNGELFSCISMQGRLSEGDACYFFRQILEGLIFMHAQNVAHRDLKPENILIDTEGNAKISDFGLSKQVGDSGLTSTPCGSPCYVAPEILAPNTLYDAKKSDMWGAGVILYAMVTGELPWTKRQQAQLFKQIRTGEYSVPANIGQSCTLLIRGLMCLDLDKRLTAEKALKHPFMAKSGPVPPVLRYVPIVSLRRLDRFFDAEGTVEDVKLRYRPVSTGRCKRNFQKEKKIIAVHDVAHVKPEVLPVKERELMVRPSGSVLVKPQQLGIAPCTTATKQDIAVNWKQIVRRANRKGGNAASGPLLIKPGVAPPIGLRMMSIAE